MSPQPGAPRPKSWMRRWLLLCLVALAVLGVLASSLGSDWPFDRHESASSGQRPETAGGPEGAPGLQGEGAARASEAGPASPGPAERLLQRLQADDGEALARTAAELRLLLRTNAEALRYALAQLQDPALAAETRARLAFVLGTLSGSTIHGALLASIAQFGDDAAYLRAALLTLGAQRDPAEADHIFALGDRPFGAVGPGGLGITIRRDIEDQKISAVLLAHLEHEDAGVRESCARALAASIGRVEIRAGLQEAVGVESRDAVAAQLVEPLGAWVAGEGAGAERDALLAVLLEKATMPGFDEARFRLEKDLARTSLPSDAWVRLLETTHPGESTSIRLFALTLLGGAGEHADGAMQKRVQARLAELVKADGDGAIRDLAARQLARLPLTDISIGILERAATRDAAWNVRYTALEALGKGGRSPALERALVHATADGDVRVAGLAIDLRERLYP